MHMLVSEDSLSEMTAYYVEVGSDGNVHYSTVDNFYLFCLFLLNVSQIYCYSICHIHFTFIIQLFLFYVVIFEQPLG